LQAIASFDVSFDMADLGFSGAEIDLALSVGREPPVEDIQSHQLNLGRGLAISGCSGLTGSGVAIVETKRSSPR
jgi:hypothetical protein